MTDNYIPGSPLSNLKMLEKNTEENAVTTKEDDVALMIDIVTYAVKIPGVKVNRSEFLIKMFEDEPIELRNKILEEGPIESGISRDRLKKMARKIVNDRTLKSSGFSFAAGLPGGALLAGTIPADTAQFFGFALRLAQEISYLYGAEDLWKDGDIDSEKVQNQLILYCGVMFGVSGASATLKLAAATLAKQAEKKIPQLALTKTVVYNMVKQICKVFGTQMNKQIFGKAVGKVIPVVGGVVSGGMTLASMRPMGFRLVHAFDDSCFDYSEEEMENDIIEVSSIIDASESAIEVEDFEVAKNDEAKKMSPQKLEEIEKGKTLNFAAEIRKAKKLLDTGVISNSEFEAIKNKIIEKM